MGGDRESSFSLDVLLPEIHISVFARVDDLDIDPLRLAWANVGGDNDERTLVGRIPNAFYGWKSVRRETELDGR